MRNCCGCHHHTNSRASQVTSNTHINAPVAAVNLEPSRAALRTAHYQPAAVPTTARHQPCHTHGFRRAVSSDQGGKDEHVAADLQREQELVGPSVWDIGLPIVSQSICSLVCELCVQLLCKVSPHLLLRRASGSVNVVDDSLGTPKVDRLTPREG